MKTNKKQVEKNLKKLIGKKVWTYQGIYKVVAFRLPNKYDPVLICERKTDCVYSGGVPAIDTQAIDPHNDQVVLLTKEIETILKEKEKVEQEIKELDKKLDEAWLDFTNLFGEDF